jgi:hypothetical protein
MPAAGTPDGLMRAAYLLSDSVNAPPDRAEPRAGESVALLGSTAAVGIAQGSTRLRIYQPGAGSTWSQAAAFSEDDLCPGGASTLTGKKNATFAPFIYKKRTFYQDRLGTNIGKTQKRVAFCAGWRCAF